MISPRLSQLVAATALLTFASLGATIALAASPPATDIGVCAVVKQAFPAKESQARIDLMKAAGINFVRTDFAWRTIEKAKGNVEFAGYDRMVGLAEKNGISILGLLSHAPKWATPLADHLDEWLVYVDTVVKRYPQVRHWEVYNEPDLQNFWGSKPDPAGYAKLLRLTYAHIKKIDASLFVTSGGLSGGGPLAGGYSGKYAEPMFAAGIAGAYDALAFHPYRFPHAPEESHYAANVSAPDKPTLEQTIGKYRALMVAAGDGGKPMWITECGYSTYPGQSANDIRLGTGRNLGVTEEEQAQFLPRSILLAFQYGASSWMWFTTLTAEKNPNDKEDWFGIVHPDHTPRLAYHALKHLRRAYPAGSTLLKEQHLKEPVYRLAWKRPDGKTGWAVWIVERGAKREVTLSIRGPVVECYDALGEPVALDVVSGRTEAPLSGRMLYIIGPEAVDPVR